MWQEKKRAAGDGGGGPAGAGRREKLDKAGIYVTDDDGALIVMASAGGSPRLPAWATNIRTNPDVSIEVLGERYRATAVETRGDERTRALARMTDALPRFGEYQRTVERQIPLFRLERDQEPAAP